MTVRCAVAAAAVVLVAGAGAARAEHQKVGVVPGIAVNLDAARVDALTQDLADALAGELDLDAVGGLEVRRLLPVEGLPPDCVATPSCVSDVAKRLGATQLLFVVMVDTGTGGAIQVDSTWVEPATGHSASRPAIDIASVADARTRFASSAHQLLPDAPARPKPKTGGNFGAMSTAVPRHFTTASIATTSVAAVGLGVGVTFGLMARSKYSDCESVAVAGGCSSSAKDAIRSRALIADLGFLAAAGGALATAIVFAGSGEASHLVVAPTTGGVAISAFGRF